MTSAIVAIVVRKNLDGGFRLYWRDRLENTYRGIEGDIAARLRASNYGCKEFTPYCLRPIATQEKFIAYSH
jgi:hypothetical protein